MKFPVPIVVALPILLTGCLSFSAKVQRIDQENRESAQVYTTGVVDALGQVEVTNRTPAVLVADELARNAQSIEGLPVAEHRLNVSKLIANNADERRRLDARMGSDSRNAIELRESEARLIKLGMEKEQENKQSLLKRISKWIIGTVGLGGFIALLVFCPALIPVIMKIFGMIASWIIGAVPSLINFIGVVGKGTVNNIVKGVGEVRDQLKTAPVDKVYTSKEVLELLDTQLATATDVKDKRVINSIRDRVNV